MQCVTHCCLSIRGVKLDEEIAGCLLVEEVILKGKKPDGGVLCVFWCREKYTSQFLTDEWKERERHGLTDGANPGQI